MVAILATLTVPVAFGQASHASTFGGTPLVASAALAVAKVLQEGTVLKNCRRVGSYFKEKLVHLQARHDVIQEVRGKGLLVGLDLKIDCGDIVTECLERGFLVNCAQGHVLRFIPPLIVAEAEVDQLIECLDAVFTNLSTA